MLRCCALFQNRGGMGGLKSFSLAAAKVGLAIKVDKANSRRIKVKANSRSHLFAAMFLFRSAKALSPTSSKNRSLIALN